MELFLRCYRVSSCDKVSFNTKIKACIAKKTVNKNALLWDAYRPLVDRFP